MASETFQLNDPVHVENTSGTDDSSSITSSSSSTTPLEGIVAHLGPVQFAPGSDWVGIRLTGSSLNQGKNSGTVKGVSYFDAGGEKNGLFVKKSHVKKRKLTKLEELRLRRELNDAGVNYSTGGSSANAGSGALSGKSPRAPTSSRIPGAAATSGISPKRTTPVRSVGGGGSDSKSATKSGILGSASKDDGKSRLEQIRARREQLARERGKGGISSAVTSDSGRVSRRSTSASTGLDDDDEDEGENENQNAENSGSKNDYNATEGDGETKQFESSDEPAINLQTATPAYRAELARLQAQIQSLQSSLKQKEAECKSLQSSLEFMSQGAEQTTHDAVRMYAMGALALTEAKTPTKGGRIQSRNLEGDIEKEKNSKQDSDEYASEDDSDDDDEDDEEEQMQNKNEQVVNQAAAAVSKALVERNNELQNQLSQLNSQNSSLQDQLSESEQRLAHMANKLETTMENFQKEKQLRIEEGRTHNADKSVMSSQISSLERELKILQERVSDKSSSQEHSQLTLAKLRAELTSYQRKNEELVNEKLDLESTLEEVVLDKEQLREEKEILEDKLEECKIDKESAELELEDVRSRLEELENAGVASIGTNAAAPGSGLDTSMDSSAGDGGSSSADVQDVARSLTFQNNRLRTAIIRLREQSELERNELLRQLTTLQSDFSSKEDVQKELDELRMTHAATLKEAQELKDVIDQTSELEQTIENLSDKVWILEDENSNLQRTIRELEESAEVAAEMEEVQSEELKMMLRDLEFKDAMVRNLEEAIKMQRRREEDFQRYVSEFRTSISTLQREKASLLALTEGDQGEKSQLLATSQKALAQAAQLAADAAETRKRDAKATFDMIDARSASYLSQRLEMFLPSGVVASELAAVKGEMILAKMADKAAVSLNSVEEVFNKAIEKGVAGLSEFNFLGEGDKSVLSDASSQQIATMVHQAEFASLTIEAASDALLLMAAGQWPELLSQEMSTDLGSLVLHSIGQLDLALSEQLNLLKQEGVLSPLRSSLSDLDQSVRSTRLALFRATDETGRSVVPTDWKPPGWEALKALSLGRFAALGATAVFASAINPMENTENEPPAPALPNLAAVLEKSKQSCATVLDVCKKLSNLPLDDTETLQSLNELSEEYQKTSSSLFDCAIATIKQQYIAKDEVDKCGVLLESVLMVSRKLAALMRKADIGEKNAAEFHNLSPESGDSWGGVTELASQVRGVDGDSEDVNYLMRARAIERQLSDAVQNEPKLLISNAKVASLEKSLASRSKEIAMQNARIAELESLIARSASSPMSPLKSSSNTGGLSVPSADIQKLKEEVRVLQEALDVTQQQADEYEKEIKALKDKSRPTRVRQTGGGRTTPRKQNSIDIEATLSQFNQPPMSKAGASSSRDILLESISLESALFRPALASSTQSANYWKSQAVGSALSKLTPLNVSVKAHSAPSSMGEEAKKSVDDIISNGFRNDDKNGYLELLSLASYDFRMAKASFSIVDLTKDNMSSRAQLLEERRREKDAESRFKTTTSAWLSRLSNDTMTIHPLTSSPEQTNREVPCGRITLPCKANSGFVASLTVDSTELRNFHSFLVQ